MSLGHVMLQLFFGKIYGTCNAVSTFSLVNVSSSARNDSATAEQILVKFYMGVFTNICREYSTLTRIELKYQALFVKTCVRI